MKKVLSEIVLPYLLLTLGAAIAALALEEFLVPFQILDGGVVGVSMIVSQLSRLPLGIFIVVLNIPFMLIGLKRLGSTFLVRALYSMLLFSVLLEVFKPLPPLTEQELLVVVFGGVLLGLGVGVILRSGGCLDGTEIVAMLLSRRVPFSTGQIVLGFNIVIYAAAGLLFGLDRALYSLLTYFITSKIIDMVQNGMEQGKAVTIITNEGKQIADALYSRLGRTCTLLEGRGLISGEKVVLYCVVTRIEVATVKQIIHAMDGSAFVTITDVSEILGQHIKQKAPAPSGNAAN
ncbi:MAG: YitT family protein [Selenomonadaceae bacterium]|nr:YitT family protein [Selenomonadaceae bacterium]